MATTVTREQVTSDMCGHQTEYGTGQARFCAETKTVDSGLCAPHDRYVRENY